MNSVNSKTSDSHKLILNLTDEIHLKRKDKYVALSNLDIYDTWKNIKIYMSAPIWNDKFELPDWIYSVSNIQSYFE